jgi:hypothetical protein
MAAETRRLRQRSRVPLVLACAVGIAWAASFVAAQSTVTTPSSFESSFEQVAKPFFAQNCMRCHNAEKATQGVNVEQLNGKLEDRHLKLWEDIRGMLSEEAMPPEDEPQPTPAARQQMVQWITSALEAARSRPAPKNGLIRRMTVSQYRNTLRELLLLEDDLTGALPPDAVSREGFLNNKDTQHLSPLLTEAYFEIADDALRRAVVDPTSKPVIQNFRVDLGTWVNPMPAPDRLVLGAGSELLNNEDVLVTQLTAKKPFPFTPFFMRTKYRFIEGYQGNDTVRGWRDFDSIYHAVFADFRGSPGYPKGKAYSTVPQGLLLRPAIPNDEVFGSDGTYGPKANFKIALRELPAEGRFRITVTAGKYDDGLLLDPGAEPQSESESAESVTSRVPNAPVTIPKAGIYQVDIYAADPPATPAPDTSRLGQALMLVPSAQLSGGAKLVDSPFGRAVSLGAEIDTATILRDPSMNVGVGDFTVSVWMRPSSLRPAGIVSLGGWYLDVVDNRGTVRLVTSKPDGKWNGSVTSRPGVIRANAWQHVAAVVKRGKNETRLYVNGFLVGRGTVGAANLDDATSNLRLGRAPSSPSFLGDLDAVRVYPRALEVAEIQGLVEPGRQFAQPPAPPPGAGQRAQRATEVVLTLGDREFPGSFSQPAYLAVRLGAGPLPVSATIGGLHDAARVVLTPLPLKHDLARRFLAFEKRSPLVGVHMGIRRDCGSSLVPVGAPQAVPNTALSKFVFEGAMHNFPDTETEKDNVNYLAGVREIGVRSEYTDGRDMPRLVVRSVEFEGPFYDSWPAPSYRNIFVESEQKTNLPVYARTVIQRFATRAYRRPITPAEGTALLKVYQTSFAAGRGFQESVKDALQVVLTSPQFLFLMENSATPNPEPLDDYELASKLSYFLWNGPPDRQALQLAATGLLHKQLDTETTRMIADPRFSRFVQEFGSQWLSLDKFQVLEPDAKQFPTLTRQTRAHLKQEPVELVGYLLRNNLPARNLVQSDFIVANEAVAGYYGLADKVESGVRFVAVSHGRPELGGLLSEAAIMAGLSDGRESNPVKRGAWLARKIIAEPPSDPPPNVPALKESEEPLTLRQRLERHRNVPACLQCHSKIDPWGVALEEFDAGGRLKQKPADARSTLPDATVVAGVNDLKRYLAEDRIDQVAFSFLKHLTTYAIGRSLTFNELNELKKDGVKLKATGYRTQDMVRYVINSPVFLEK